MDCKTKIQTWCPKFGTRYSIGFVDCEFKDPNYKGQSPYRKLVHSLYANLAVELNIREHYDFLKRIPEIKDLEFYEKKNWGKCIIFDWKGSKLMANGSSYFFHEPEEYSLSEARPKISKFISKY